MSGVVMVSEQIGGGHKGAWAQLVQNLPTVQETQVPSLGWEDPLEKEMAAHSSILAWKILWIEEPGRRQSQGSQKVGHDLTTKPPQGACVGANNAVSWLLAA